MNTTNQVNITVEATVNAPVETVWNAWTSPEHIVKWNCASEDWHTPKAENDVRTGGKFMSRMEAKDGSFGFDFEGIYDEVKVNEIIAYTLGDNRKVRITFNGNGNKYCHQRDFRSGKHQSNRNAERWLASHPGQF